MVRKRVRDFSEHTEAGFDVPGEVQDPMSSPRSLGDVPVPSKPQDPPKIEAKPEKKADPGELTHRVAPNRSIRCKSGVLLPSGTPVSAEVVGGVETFEALARGGSIVELV